MKVSHDELKSGITGFLRTYEITQSEAEILADNLICAELRGISTHGINFLPMLVERIRKGVLEVPTRMEILSDREAVIHIDGGNGLGQPVTALGMRKAMEKAREYGVGLGLIRNTNHIGLLAYYSMMAAEEGMVGVCMCNSAASMAPWGGAVPFFGTNPLSVAAMDSSGIPVVLDMSTSVAARGKIRRASRLKEKIPRGWALDAAGNPTEDPGEALKGSLLPIGGPKGYGLAFFIDLICGLLSGSKYAREVSTFHQPLSPTGVGVMVLAMDISRFMPLEVFQEAMRRHVLDIQSSEKSTGTARIYVPGEIEQEKQTRALRDGVEIDDSVMDTVKALFLERGVRPLRKFEG